MRDLRELFDLPSSSTRAKGTKNREQPQIDSKWIAIFKLPINIERNRPLSQTTMCLKKASGANAIAFSKAWTPQDVFPKSAPFAKQPTEYWDVPIVFTSFGLNK